MRVIAASLILVTAIPAAGQGPALAVLEAYAARSQQERSAAIDKASREYRIAAKNKRTSRQVVANLKRDLERLQDGERPFFGTLFISDVRPNCVGALDRDVGVKIVQVTSDSRALVLLHRTTIVGGQSFSSEKYAMLDGVDTSNLVDDARYGGPRLMYCPGTTTYDTAGGGTNTVAVLRVLDREEIRHLFVSWSAARTWTSSSGDHKTKAVIVKFDGEVVTLVNKDRKTKDVPASQLSARDRRYAERWLAKREWLSPGLSPKARPAESAPLRRRR